DHHLGVFGRKRLAEQGVYLELDLLLIVDELVEAFCGTPRRVDEVFVLRVVAEEVDAFEDLLVALGEESECLGVELHGVSSYVCKIAAVAAAMPSVRALAIPTRTIAS